MRHGLWLLYPLCLTSADRVMFVVSLSTSIPEWCQRWILMGETLSGAWHQSGPNYWYRRLTEWCGIWKRTHCEISEMSCRVAGSACSSCLSDLTAFNTGKISLLISLLSNCVMFTCLWGLPDLSKGAHCTGTALSRWSLSIGTGLELKFQTRIKPCRLKKIQILSRSQILGFAVKSF